VRTRLLHWRVRTRGWEIGSEEGSDDECLCCARAARGRRADAGGACEHLSLANQGGTLFAERRRGWRPSGPRRNPLTSSPGMQARWKTTRSWSRSSAERRSPCWSSPLATRRLRGPPISESRLTVRRPNRHLVRVLSPPGRGGFPLRDKAKALTVSGLSCCLGVDCLNAVQGGIPGQASTLLRGSLGQGKPGLGGVHALRTLASRALTARLVRVVGVGWANFWVAISSLARRVRGPVRAVPFQGGSSSSPTRPASRRCSGSGRRRRSRLTRRRSTRGISLRVGDGCPGSDSDKGHAPEQIRGPFEAVAG
jgi:hypothetical protein